MAAKRLQGVSIQEGMPDQAVTEGGRRLKEGDLEDWLGAMFTPAMLLGIVLLLSC